jgi:hypothetical protein
MANPAARPSTPNRSKLEQEKLRLEFEKLDIERARLERSGQQNADNAPSEGKSLIQSLANPLVLAVAGGFLSILTAIVTNYLSSSANRESDLRKAELTRTNESLTLQSDLLKTFLKTDDADIATSNLTFLVESGLIPDHADRIKNYIAQNKGAPRISQASGLTSPTAVCPLISADPQDHIRDPQTGALGISLNIGVNRVAEEKFGMEHALFAPLDDAVSIFRMASKAKYQSILLVDSAARSDCLLNSLVHLPKLLKRGDNLIISMSGMGARADKKFEPSNINDEFDVATTNKWVLYDKLLPVGEFGEILSRLDAGVLVVIIQDVVAPDYFEFLDRFRNLNASVVVLSSSLTDEMALDSSDGKSFSRYIADIIESKGQDEVLDYNNLVEKIKIRFSSDGINQTPNVKRYGPQDNVLSLAPFVIGAR